MFVDGEGGWLQMMRSFLQYVATKNETCRFLFHCRVSWYECARFY